MDFFPVFLNLKGRRCVIGGGGEVAGHKALLLRRAGAEVVVQAPMIGEAMAALVRADGVQHRTEHFDESVLDGAMLVIAATSDAVVNREVHAAALRRRSRGCCVRASRH